MSPLQVLALQEVLHARFSQPRTAKVLFLAGPPGGQQAGASAALGAPGQANRDYFRGAANVARVQAWRKEHPGYWKRPPRQAVRALQDACPPQPVALERFAAPLPTANACALHKGVKLESGHILLVERGGSQWGQTVKWSAIRALIKRNNRRPSDFLKPAFAAALKTVFWADTLLRSRRVNRPPSTRARRGALFSQPSGSSASWPGTGSTRWPPRSSGLRPSRHRRDQKTFSAATRSLKAKELWFPRSIAASRVQPVSDSRRGRIARKVSSSRTGLNPQRERPPPISS